MQRGSGVRLDPHSSVKGNTVGCNGVPRNFVGGGVQKIQLRIQDIETGIWGR